MRTDDHGPDSSGRARFAGPLARVRPCPSSDRTREDLPPLDPDSGPDPLPPPASGPDFRRPSEPTSGRPSEPTSSNRRPAVGHSPASSGPPDLGRRVGDTTHGPDRLAGLAPRASGIADRTNPLPATERTHFLATERTRLPATERTRFRRPFAAPRRRDRAGKGSATRALSAGRSAFTLEGLGRPERPGWISSQGRMTIVMRANAGRLRAFGPGPGRPGARSGPGRRATTPGWPTTSGSSRWRSTSSTPGSAA